MAKLRASEVTVTLESGEVLDFKVALGDDLYVNEVVTYKGNRPETGSPVKYYTIQVHPVRGDKGRE